MIVEALIVALALVGVAFLRSRSPAEARSEPGPGIGPQLVDRLALLEADQKALKQQLQTLELTIEQRHRSVTGMIARDRRRQRGGDEEEADPEEAIATQQALAALEQSLTAPRDLAGNGAAPVGGGGGAPRSRRWGY